MNWVLYIIKSKRGDLMKRFLLLAAGAALLTACETASEIDAIASGASGSSATTSTASSGSSDSSSSSSSSTSSSGASGSSSDSTTTYSYDTDPKTALIKVGDRVLFGYDSSELDDDDRSVLDNQAKFLNQNPTPKLAHLGLKIPLSKEPWP